MKLPPDQQRVSVLLQDTVTLLCKNGLDYSHQFCVDGTIGITIDERNVFLVKLDQKIFKDANEKRERHTSNEGGGNRVRKRKTVVESEPGLFNGNHNDSTYSSLKSGSKMPRLQGSTGCLLDSHSVPTKKRSVDTKLTESIEHSDIENDTPPKDVNAVFPSTLLDDKDEQLERTSRHNDQNNTDSSSMTLVKQEPDSGGNNTDLAMQLLYPQSENATEGNNTTVKSDILNIEHQVTGPPVWPEPTLSLSAGLTLPTVIAPTNSTATVIDSGSPQAEEESSGHANSSQMAFQIDRSRLIHGGYNYHKNRQAPNSSKAYWRCCNRKCPGRVIVNQGKIEVRGQHTHPARFTDWSENTYPTEDMSFQYNSTGYMSAMNPVCDQSTRKIP